jgi:hypothetical protein
VAAPNNLIEARTAGRDTEAETIRNQIQASATDSPVGLDVTENFRQKSTSSIAPPSECPTQLKPAAEQFDLSPIREEYTGISQHSRGVNTVTIEPTQIQHLFKQYANLLPSLVLRC